ncbi:probable ATP-dependent RNA helicase DDX4 isoform X1 [Macaca nemestrina]|nr:probable ATP-dependent RNA helicase DDX4 isoform X1 [Macaca nemestrina]XP_011770245.1 probable ATP-dependent RNA helicase DDX4 isoform X1 [Macaca nemestrina]XP_014995525.1 probable ATP-dependent RNA helicase DDX4 isoform X1 [Macaca mulatta]XP_014995526.1 probable ATP-dependent RNA helicase DDX4 isoform X1 [Macaca mulatta]XP_015306877.1 probable ATP-dependent RNA helicase DDX4 isoform X1 [Macaca fascicularis]XP_050651087.1 probable ATP-dependent RNA helicase DDX4 isoform X1 [Macaca thibetana
MGDEDWEAEINPHMSSYVPIFEKDRYSSGENGDNFNRTPTSSSEMDDGPSRRDHFMKSGFASGRNFGNRDAGESNKRDNTSTMGGFGVGKSFGNRGFSNSKFEDGDSSGFWRESSNDCEDNPTRNRGFSKRGVLESQKSEIKAPADSLSGYRDGNNSEASGPSRRGGRGSFRGCRGGFGLGSPNNDLDPDECMQRTGGLFGSRRPALSGTGNGDTSQSRSGSGSERGGYKGLNEEVITGSGKNSWKSEAEGGESSDTQGPKVTYIPPPPPEDEDSIFAHYQTGINFDKYDTILVEVSGHDAPPAILTFEEANLCQTLNNNIAKAGYTKLTPVQKYSIPIILAGRDLMACAQTGSGKTAAFLLPILAHMMHDGITASRFKELQEPECIIVAPTRELVNQIYLEARKFSFGTCVRAVVIYGGTQLGHSIRQIVQGCNILCATPGRLMDIIGKEKIGLKQIKYLVLDEADRMLDMGFGPEMKKLISCPGMPSKEQRQTLMFSATFPEEIQRLAAEFLKSNYLFVAVGQVGGACRDVQQTVLQVGQFSKREKLVEILRNIGDERTMVFVETKKKADFIATFLCQEKISTTSIHGDREQREREQALGDFRCGKCPVLVATSVAARGLDIENVQHVINFDLPSTIDEYVHRIGRTGRCGNTGRAISFFDLESDNHLAQPLVKVLTDAQQDVPAWLEEIAFSTYIPGFSGSTRGNVFASVDTRKGKSSLNTAGFSSSQAPNPVDDESWD